MSSLPILSTPPFPALDLLCFPDCMSLLRMLRLPFPPIERQSDILHFRTCLCLQGSLRPPSSVRERWRLEQRTSWPRARTPPPHGPRRGLSPHFVLLGSSLVRGRAIRWSTPVLLVYVGVSPAPKGGCFRTSLPLSPWTFVPPLFLKRQLAFFLSPRH